MKPEYTKDMNIRARCPDCNGAITTFERNYQNRDLGYVIIDFQHVYNKEQFTRIFYRLFRCAGCGRGGLGKLHVRDTEAQAALEAFLPVSIDRAKIPANVPAGISAELREAELCASVGAIALHTSGAPPQPDKRGHFWGYKNLTHLHQVFRLKESSRLLKNWIWWR